MLNPKYTKYADRLRELIEEGQRVGNSNLSMRSIYSVNDSGRLPKRR